MTRILSVMVLGALVMAGDGTGCLGPDRPDDTTCPAVACDVACPAGQVKDANGCDTCECVPVTSLACWMDSDCTGGLVCDRTNYCEAPPGCRDGMTCPAVCYGRCVKPTTTTSCYSDAQCATGETCSFDNCGAPPCPDGAACMPIACAGHCAPAPVDDSLLCVQSGGEWMRTSCGHARCGQLSECAALIPGCNCGEKANFVEGKGCVASPECNPGLCEGATRDAVGRCLGAYDQPLPEECCKPQPPTCGDGTPNVCRRAMPICPAPLILATYEGCWRCVDPIDCSTYCTTDADCTTGSQCVQRGSAGADAPCFSEGDQDGGTNCRPAPPPETYGVCQPVAPQFCVSDRECPAGLVCLPENADGAGRPGDFAVRNTCQKPPDTCMCTQEYAPVCGADGRTYGNACEAACAGVYVVAQGECQPITCAVDCFQYDPVCGADGVTYACGEADAKCHNTTVAYPGECRQDCVCDQMYAPVCGADGRTYGNACEAGCAGVPVVGRGECAITCEIACFQYDPVCGEDGVTYACGEADAKCHNTTVAYDGECQIPSGCMSDADCTLGDKCYSDPRIDTAYGQCVPTDYCILPSDCEGQPQPLDCVGSWSCGRNHCSFACGT